MVGFCFVFTWQELWNKAESSQAVFPTVWNLPVQNTIE